MPRRKIPFLKRADIDASLAEAHRNSIDEAVRTDKVFKRLKDEVQNRLVNDFVDAIGFYMVPTAEILSGKGAKPTAWRLDIFVKDVGDAMKRAGILAIMDPDPEASQAQYFANHLLKICGIATGSKLFKQMQRAKRI